MTENVGMAECDGCGARMPLREAFTTEHLLKLVDQISVTGRYQAAEGPCACGGTLREDLGLTDELLRRFVFDQPQ